MHTSGKTIVVAILALTLALGIPPWAMAQDTMTTAGTLQIEEAVVCRAVMDRTPVEGGDVFPSDVERLYFFTRVSGGSEDDTIYHNWYYGDQQVVSVLLAVRSSNWRTWSSKAIVPAYTGEWAIEVTTADGTLLKKVVFLVQ
jgi:hypothetical protein